MGAPTAYYVDPAINANSGTGTSGDPFGDLQYALNTVTRDSTNGDIFHIKAGTSEVLAASLSLASYGTPSATAPLIFRGYSSTAGDGGVGVIDGAGSYSIFATQPVGFVARDMRFTNSGSSALLYVGNECVLEGCQFDNTTSSSAYVVRLGSTSVVYRCVFKDYSGFPRFGGGSDVFGCVFDVGNNSTQPSYAVYFESTGGAGICSGNRVRIGKAGSATHGIAYQATGSTVRNNSIWSNGGTGVGIQPAASGLRDVAVVNNYVEGFSGSGGKGIRDDNTGTKPIYAVFGYNKVYNCATAFDISGDKRIDLGGDATLGSSGLTDAAGGDFSPTADLDDDGYPTSYASL